MKNRNILLILIAILTLGLVIACSDDVVAKKDNSINSYRVIESNGAFVYNGEKYETLQDALDAVKDSKSVGPESVITATRDVISPAVTVADGQSVALDLGGHTITFYGVEQSALTIGSDSLFGILNGTLTLQDTNNEDLAVIYAKDANFLGLSGVTVKAEGQNALVADGVEDVFVTDGSSITGDTTVVGGYFFLGGDDADTSSMNGLTSLSEVHFNSDESTSVEGTLIETGSYLKIDNEMDADIELNGVSTLEVGPNGHATISVMDSSDGKTIVSSQGEGAITNNSGKAIPVVEANAKISRDDGQTYSYYASLSAAVESLDADGLVIVAMAPLAYEGTLEPAYSVGLDLAGFAVTVDFSTAKALTLSNTGNDAVFTGNLTGTGTTEDDGFAVYSGITVDGNVTVASTFEAEGATFNGDISAAGVAVCDVEVNGTITSTGDMVSDSSEFNGEINVTGNLTDGTVSEDPAPVYSNGSTFKKAVTVSGTATFRASTINNGGSDDGIFADKVVIYNSTVYTYGFAGKNVSDTAYTAATSVTVHNSTLYATGLSAKSVNISTTAINPDTAHGELYLVICGNINDLSDPLPDIDPSDSVHIIESTGEVRYILAGTENTPEDEFAVTVSNGDAEGNLVVAAIASAGYDVALNGPFAGTAVLTVGPVTSASLVANYVTQTGDVSATGIVCYENSVFGGSSVDIETSSPDDTTEETPVAALTIKSSTGTAGSLRTTGNSLVSGNRVYSSIVVDNSSFTAEATPAKTLSVGSVSSTYSGETAYYGNVTIKGGSAANNVTVAGIANAEAVQTNYAVLSGSVNANGAVALTNSVTQADVTSATSVSANASTLGNDAEDDIYAPFIFISDSTLNLSRLMKSSTSVAADLIKLVNVSGSFAEAKVTAVEDADYSDNDQYAFYLSNAAETAALNVGKVTAEGGTVGEQAIQAVFVSNASANGLALASIDAPKGDINIDGTSVSAPVTVNSAVTAEDGSITADYAFLYGSVSSPVSFTATHSSVWDTDTIDNTVYAPVIRITEASSLNLSKLGKDADTAADEVVLNITEADTSYVGTINAVKLVVTSADNKLTVADTTATGDTTINGGTYTKTALSGTTLINDGVFSNGEADVDHILSGKTTIADGEFSGYVKLEGEDTNVSNSVIGGTFTAGSTFVYNSRGNLLITGGMFYGTTSIERGTGEIKGTCDKDLDPCNLYFAHLDVAVNEWYIRSARIDVVDSDNLNVLSSKIVQASGSDYVYIYYKTSELNDIVVTPNSSNLRVVLKFDSVVTKQTKVKIDSRVELSGVIKLFGGDYNKLYSNRLLATPAATPVGIVVNNNSPSVIVDPKASEDPSYPSMYWIPNEYWVSFYKEKTSTNPATQRFYLNEAQDLRKNDYTRDHYTFQGWDTADTATTVVYADRESYTFTSTTESTLKLYAVWQPDTRSISYTPDHCTFSDKTEIYEYSETADTVFVFRTSPDEGYTVTSISASVAGVTVEQYEESGVPVANKWQVTIPKQTFENVVLYASSTNVYDIVYPIPGTNCYISDMTANSYTYDKDTAFEFYFRITPYTGYEVKAKDITSDRTEGTVVFAEVSDGYFKGTIKKQTLGTINITVTPTPIVYNVTLAGTTAKYSVTPKNTEAPYYTYTFGTQQVFTIAPNPGYMVTSLSVTGASGPDVETAQSGDNWTVTVPEGTYGALTIDATVNPKIIYSATNCSIAATSGTLPQYYVEGTGVSFDAIASYNSTYQFKEYSVTSGVTMTETASAAGSKTYSVSIPSSKTGAVEIAVTVNPVYSIICLNKMTGDAAKCQFTSDKTTYTFGTQTVVVVTAKDYGTTKVQTGWFNWDHALSVSGPVELDGHDGYKWTVTIPASYTGEVYFTFK